MNVAPYIGRALRENSGLRIFVGQGYYDFATPFFGAEYALSPDRHPAATGSTTNITARAT